jgi:hypothetical protein
LAGAELAPIVLSLGIWGQKWSRRELETHEIDLGLLLWAIERGAKPDALGRNRTVVQLTLTDQVEKKRRWWFLNEAGQCELCLTPPAHDIDLFLETTLPDMIYVWRGDLPLSRALDTGRLLTHGMAKFRRALPRWLGVSPLAHVKSARAGALTV